MTKIQLDNGFIDVDIDFPVTITFADIKEKGVRSGGYSNTIQVEGSNNNIQVLGYYFDVDLESTTFDRNKKQECTIIQNGISVFDGYLQLIEVNRVNKHTHDRKITYTVFVFDEVANFFNEMGQKNIDELSFPEYNHVFNRANILDSWANTEGYIYPIFAKDNTTYTLRDFKPALFEKAYFDKIFAVNGYSYTFDELSDLDIRFDKRIIPYNGKVSNEFLKAELQNQFKFKGDLNDYNQNIVQSMPNGYVTMLDHISAGQLEEYFYNQVAINLNTIQDIAGQKNVGGDFSNLSGDNRTMSIKASVTGILRMGANDDWQVFGGANNRCEVVVCMVAISFDDPSKSVVLNTIPVLELNSGDTFSAALTNVGNINFTAVGDLGLLDANENYALTPLVSFRYFNAQNDLIQPNSFTTLPFISSSLATASFLNSTLGLYFASQANNQNLVNLIFNLSLSNISVEILPDIEELVQGANVVVDNFIPRNIKQRDLIASISKSYNLIFEPDKDNEKNIIIKTRDKYIDDGQEWDWTNKLAEDFDNSLKFISNEVSREQIYTYKEDEDLINEAYQGQTSRIFGDAKLKLDNEYIQGSDKRELVYSPTPNIQSKTGVTLPAIDGIEPDNNIRVLLVNGLLNCTPFAFYDDIVKQGSFEMVNQVLHTSMFDSDTLPNFSICYDSPRYLMHTLAIGQTSNYLYNLHHRRELTIVNKGRILTGYFRLTEDDFQKLSKSLQYKIYIRDNGWFYVSKVDKYNANKNTLTKVELVQLDDEVDIFFIKQDEAAPPPFGKSEGSIKGFFNINNLNTNIIQNASNVVVQGLYNIVNGASDVQIMGNDNIVFGSKSKVIGDGNTLGHGAANSIVGGNQKTLNTPQQSIGDTSILLSLKVQSTTTGFTFTEVINNVGVIDVVADNSGRLRLDLPTINETGFTATSSGNTIDTGANLVNVYSNYSVADNRLQLNTYNSIGVLTQFEIEQEITLTLTK